MFSDAPPRLCFSMSNKAHFLTESLKVCLFLSGLETTCMYFKDSEHGPDKVTTQSILADGIVTTCQAIVHPQGHLFFLADMVVQGACFTDWKFRVRLSLQNYATCEDVNFLMTKMTQHTSTITSSCLPDERMLKCIAVADYRRINTFCEYECQCRLEAGQDHICSLYIAPHASSPVSGQICDLRLIP